MCSTKKQLVLLSYIISLCSRIGLNYGLVPLVDPVFKYGYLSSKRQLFFRYGYIVLNTHYQAIIQETNNI